jgi:serine/threonine protein kinase
MRRADHEDAAVEPLTGDDPGQIAGYRLRARLGSGGMGRVYLAVTSSGRPVALKVVRSDLGDDAEFRLRFRQEIDAARRVHGLYTAQVVDADPDASPPWLATAYVPGPSLHEVVAAHGPVPEETVFVLVAGVAEALAAIHAAGIVHRDLKPSNVLLAPDGPRVIDFGIARAADATALTRTGALIGSAPFMSPEQVKGEAVTAAADIFALGAVAAFAATGRPPFGGGGDMGILYRVAHAGPDLDGCPPGLAELVGRCLAKDPAGRPSLAEIIAECRAWTSAPSRAIDAAWLPPEVLAILAPELPQASRTQQGQWLTRTTTGRAAAVPVPLGNAPSGQGPTWPGVPGRADPGRRPAHRAVSRRPVILGGGLAAVAAVALTVVGLSVFSSPPGKPGTSGTPGTSARSLAAVAKTGTATPAPSGSHHPAATVTRSPRSAGSTPAAAASASPSISYAVDSCIVGTWKDAGDVLDNTIDGDPMQFTGAGGGLVVHADGSATQQQGPETLTATDSAGNTWAEVLGGSVAYHIATSRGVMRFSDVNAAPDAQYKLYKNGIFDNSGPISVSTAPLRYSCSPSTLRLDWSDGTSTYHRTG